jgi:hypothetical protein
MFKILSYLASLLFGKRLMSVPYEAIVDYAIAQIRSMAKSAALGFAGMVLLLTGALVAFFNILATYDMKGYVMMSAVAGGGVTICAIGAVLVLFATYKKTHVENIVRPSDMMAAQSHSPLDEAFAGLINEFVQNRKEKHQAEATMAQQQQYQSQHRNQYQHHANNTSGAV